jgi:hypothetical protein
LNHRAELLSFTWSESELDAHFDLNYMMKNKKKFQVSLLEGQKLVPMFSSGRIIYLHPHAGMTTNR